MALEVVTEDQRWETLGLADLAARAAKETLARSGVDFESAELAILACDDARIAKLNENYRGKPAPTNVLSWPANDLAPELAGDNPLLPEPEPDGTIPLGDIAIAWETCAREAAQQGKSMEDHVTHLIVHGTLHLLGYDHLRDPDATKMEAIEVEILGKLGLPDPY